MSSNVLKTPSVCLKLHTIMICYVYIHSLRAEDENCYVMSWKYELCKHSNHRPNFLCSMIKKLFSSPKVSHIYLLNFLFNRFT
jgi:hypothetical protein